MRGSAACIVSALVWVAACGGSGSGASPLGQDLARNFVGTWFGPIQVKIGDGTLDSQELLEIDRADINRLTLKNFCSGADASATVTGQTTFEIDPIVCPPQAQPCGPVTLAVAHGSGQLVGGQVQLTMSGSVSGCSVAEGYQLTYSGAPDHGPPVVSISPAALRMLAGTSVALTAAASDPDGRAITFSWSVASASPSCNLASDGARSATFSTAWPGTYTLQVEATSVDGQVAVATATVDVYPNSPPVVAPGAPEYQAQAGTPVALAASATDPQGLPLRFAWAVAAQTVAGTSSFTGADTATPSFTAVAAGTYTLTVMVTASDGRSATAEVTVVVAARSLPLVSAGPAIVTDVGKPVTLAAAASDPAGLPVQLAWSVTSQPPGATPVFTGTHAAAPIFTPDVAGTYTLQVLATDSDGDTASASTTVAVRPLARSYVLIESEPYEYVGAGQTAVYVADAETTLSVSANQGRLDVAISGPTYSSGNFLMPGTTTQLAPGTYENLTRYPFNAAGAGGMDWSASGRGCNTLAGWFVIDQVTYTGGALTSIDLRFEQYCDGSTRGLVGLVHWVGPG